MPWQLGSGTFGMGAIGATPPAPELFTQADEPATMQDIVDNWRDKVNSPPPQSAPTVAYRALPQYDDAGNAIVGANGRPVYATSVAFAPVNPGRFNDEIHIQQNIDSYVETYNDYPSNVKLVDGSGQVVLPGAHVDVLGAVGSDTPWYKQMNAGMNQRLSDAVANAEDQAVQNRNPLQYIAAQFFPRSTGGAVITAAGGPMIGLGLKSVGAIALTRGAPLALQPSVIMRSSSELMGVEPASPELLAAVASKRSLVIAKPGSDELRMLDYFGAEASVGGVNNSSIVLRENPSKAAVLEEFLHGTQSRLGIVDRLGTSGLGSAETQVKDFMIRHQQMLGLSNEDIRILQILRDKGL